jgi:hypothetical protein
MTQPTPSPERPMTVRIVARERRAPSLDPGLPDLDLDEFGREPGDMCDGFRCGPECGHDGD